MRQSLFFQLSAVLPILAQLVLIPFKIRCKLFHIINYKPVTLCFCTDAEPFIGVNYGQVADNLPPPFKTAKLLQSTSIQKVRLYGADPAIIKALVEATSDKSSGKIQPKSDVELNFCFAPKKTYPMPIQHVSRRTVPSSA
ncbi:hypothetical protein F2Q69_00008422 [Brassica cretica]|uniref:Glucan endo-1,3-beta-D-glucosidase n=1 Tax=Brassica cretica TaxID=69181 RepID=A0A8S9P9H0_BRACR|nr:hypothetical protein F2Q69_00008422 [Brassica cretica]